MNLSPNPKIADAWRNCEQTPTLATKFATQATIFHWSYRFEISPFWAYWFARQVLMDSWPAGEELINQDLRVKRLYRDYTTQLRQLGIFGATRSDDDIYELAPNGQIVGYKIGRQPLRQTLQQWAAVDDVSETPAAIADRIAANMAQHRKQRQLHHDDD